jgi:hypothetical protein
LVKIERYGLVLQKKNFSQLGTEVLRLFQLGTEVVDLSQLGTEDRIFLAVFLVRN